MTPDTPPHTHLLYLHGFRSSPASHKAQLLARRVARDFPRVRWWCPQLPASPAAAVALLRAGLRDWPLDTTVICGSSLGGFYARYLQLALGGAAVLLNPAAHPARDLARHIGEWPCWQNPQERLFFRSEHVHELAALEAELAERAAQRPTAPERLWALIATGDEVLDWREMMAFCAGGTVELIDGGDHAISDFEQRIDRVLTVMRLDARP